MSPKAATLLTAWDSRAADYKPCTADAADYKSRALMMLLLMLPSAAPAYPYAHGRLTLDGRDVTHDATGVHTT